MKKARIPKQSKLFRKAFYGLSVVTFLGLLYWASRGDKLRIESGTPAGPRQGNTSETRKESNIPRQANEYAKRESVRNSRRIDSRRLAQCRR